MPFKINVSHKGKTFKLESESEEVVGKNIGETIQGKDTKGDDKDDLNAFMDELETFTSGEHFKK